MIPKPRRRGVSSKIVEWVERHNKKNLLCSWVMVVSMEWGRWKLGPVARGFDDGKLPISGKKKKKNSKLQATHIVVGPDTFSTVQIKSQSPPTPAHSPQLDITIMVPLNHSMIPCRSTCGCRKQPLSSQVSCAYKRIDTSLPIKFLATPKCQYNKHLNWAPQYTWQKE